MTPWLTRNLTRVAVAVLIVLAIAGALVARSCRESTTARTAAHVAQGQAAAAIASGADAAGTVGARAATDATTDQLTRENADAIHHAQGADAPVAAAVRDAGLASLCRRAAYRGDRRCVQHPDP